MMGLLLVIHLFDLKFLGSVKSRRWRIVRHEFNHESVGTKSICFLEE